jgi:putative transcriptional regulator
MNNRIKEYEARHDMTREYLAKKANERRETIIFLEKNKYNPSMKLAHDIAVVFGIPIEYKFILNSY